MFKRLLPIMMLVLAAWPAWGTTTYASYGAMTSANPDITFTVLNLTDLSSDASGSTYTFDGVTFTGNLQPNDFGWGTVIQGLSGTSITIQLPTEAVAFGGSFGYSGTVFNVTLSGGGLETSYEITSSPTYIGFVNATPFTAITFAAQLGGVALNSVSFGVPKATDIGDPPVGDAPEPASMALMGGALAALGLMVQRRKRRAGRPEASEQ